MPDRGKLVVVDQGYVGFPLAMRAVQVGYHVVGLDIDQNRVKRLANGESYGEDISANELSAALASGRYMLSTSPELAEAQPWSRAALGARRPATVSGSESSAI